MMRKPPETNKEPSWNNNSLFLGTDEQNFSGTTTCPWKLSRTVYGFIYRFQEEDAPDGTSSAPFDPVGVPVISFLLNVTDTINAGVKMH